MLLRAIYGFLKQVVRVSLKLFYRRTEVLGWDRELFRGPGIVVSNHPSTLLDPLNVVLRVPRMVYFLANAGLFRHPFANWFFNTFYCIPIEREKDVVGRKPDNTRSFARSRKHLAAGGMLYMAPEGTSEPERHLRPVKTGCARITLQAEEDHDFQLGVRIWPVGLTYSNPRACRARVVVHFGQPIEVRAYRELYLQDSPEAVRRLTADLRRCLLQLMVATRDAGEETLLSRTEALLDAARPLPWKESYYRSRRLLCALRMAAEEQPRKFERWRKSLLGHCAELKALRLFPLPAFGGSFAGHALRLFLGFPFFLAGYLAHWLPMGLPLLVNRWLNDDPSYDATYKYLSGLVLFPVVHILQGWGLVGLFGG
ncbi:MAG: hypothetical protein D6765_12385, partial [Bacteroidetes bacterium]